MGKRKSRSRGRPARGKLQKRSKTASQSRGATPITSRSPVLSGVLATGTVLAPEFEHQLAAQARGVTRKNVPMDNFHSLYLWSFPKERTKPALPSTKSIETIGAPPNWKEKKFWDRLKRALSVKGACINDLGITRLNLSYAGTTTLRDTDPGKEPFSKPDFLLHRIGDGGTPQWQDVELLMEHTESQNSASKVTEKFMQWLRNAWNTFHHQPYRRHLYGIMFIKPCAYICYADHGTAAYSEPLGFKSPRHIEFLTNFLSTFIADVGLRGSDPTVQMENEDTQILHAGKWWTELRDGLLWYRPCVVGRSIRVCLVRHKGEMLVMKSVWEEKLPDRASPPNEPQVLHALKGKGVRGLPKTYHIESAAVRGDDESEVVTCDFPNGCDVAIAVKTDTLMKKIEGSFVLAPGIAKGTAVGEAVRRVDHKRDGYNEELKVRRRLTRILMSYCMPLKEYMRFRGPRALTSIIRDAMIVHYEAYKIGGFIHGDISVENILVPLDTSELTGGCRDRAATLVDWNLCFNADGKASNRNFKSGTPVFMSPQLLSDKPLARRTLAHDLESFFAVTIWIASYVYSDEAAFREKPLGEDRVLNATPLVVGLFKKAWFTDRRSFKDDIIEHMERPFRTDSGFCVLLLQLCELLYPPVSDAQIEKELAQEQIVEVKEEEYADTKESVVWECMKLVDKYLGDEKGTAELLSIENRAGQP